MAYSPNTNFSYLMAQPSQSFAAANAARTTSAGGYRPLSISDFGSYPAGNSYNWSNPSYMLPQLVSAKLQMTAPQLELQRYIANLQNQQSAKQLAEQQKQAEFDRWLSEQQWGQEYLYGPTQLRVAQLSQPKSNAFSGFSRGL